jgi:hypothetical protein
MTKKTKTQSPLRAMLFEDKMIFGPDDLLQRVLNLADTGRFDAEGIERLFLHEVRNHPRCINEIVHRWFLDNASRAFAQNYTGLPLSARDDKRPAA